MSPSAPREPREPSRYPITRFALFISGLGLTVFQVLAGAPSPTLLVLCAAMMGLPSFLGSLDSAPSPETHHVAARRPSAIQQEVQRVNDIEKRVEELKAEFYNEVGPHKWIDCDLCMHFLNYDHFAHPNMPLLWQGDNT